MSVPFEKYPTLNVWCESFAGPLNDVVVQMHAAAMDLFGYTEGRTETVIVTIHSHGVQGFSVTAEREHTKHNKKEAMQ